ncbi:MAG: N-acetylmuramoyl-L-alanine amidase [Melioribacteraceae bacterium]
MKKWIAFFTLFISLIACCPFLLGADKLSFDFYKDKIALINLSSDKALTAVEIKNKIESGIASAKLQNSDAVIFNANFLSQAILNSLNKESAFKITEQASELAESNNLFFFVEINFDKLNKASRLVDIRKNISELVTKTELSGLYFSGIDFASEADNDLLEELLVECLIVKPFLSISISKGDSDTDRVIADKYIQQGIIDFILDDDSDHSIIINPAVGASEEKLLQRYLKRLQPEAFISLNLSNVTDKYDSEVNIVSQNRTKKFTADKKVNFIFTAKSDTLRLKIGKRNLFISKADWVIPYNYKLNKDNSVSRYGNWVEFRRPFEKNTSNNTYNLLCRTVYLSTVKINNEPVKLYTTGIFFKKIKLTEGLNKLRAEVKDEKGNTALYEDRVFYTKPDISKTEKLLAIEESSIEPAENISLTPADFLNVSFIGTKAQTGYVEISPGNQSFECSRNDFNGSSQYRIQIPLKNIAKNQALSIKLILKSANDAFDPKIVEKILPHTLLVKEADDFPILATTSANSTLTFTLAPIRLGAPIRNELPKDVILKSTGIFGAYYRIRLSDTEEGYINHEFVKEMPSNTILPSYFINPITSSSSETTDIVKIPYLENVPFDVYPEPLQNRITINLYGVKTSSTWIIHRNDLRYIEEITWQQTSKETYKIFVNLKTSKIWGYDLKVRGKELVFRIKYPPTYNVENKLPLKGIKFSLEAGHGGSNSGAVSLSGIKEKDINLKLTKLLESILKKNGAEVLLSRDSDKDMLLLEKRDIATNSDANIHISIHANSSDPENEFLGASGTCTFYHNPFWAKLAEKIFYRMIELGFKPFGSVGSFNYRVTRMSEMPSILVEQAFMSHAEDEEKLADDDFRMKMAEKIYSGIIDYLKYMKN